MNHILHALPRGVSAVVLSAGLLFAAAAPAQTINTIAGNDRQGFGGDGGPATSASLAGPWDVTVDGAGNRYIADSINYRIRKVTPAGIISTVAGNGTYGFSGDGGPATSAQLGRVYQIAVDAGGTLYLGDQGSNRVRKVTPAGIISTIAGNGTVGFSGDGGPATDASINGAIGIVVDGVGNIYFGDHSNHRIRKIALDGTISTVAGNGIGGFSGDGGPATSASLHLPLGISTDTVGNLYIAEASRIRKVTSGGIISTVAGNGTYGFGGDGGPATSASFQSPWDVAADNGGNLYIADSSNNRIRKVSATGVISTFAGNGSAGFSGDGGPAANATLSTPRGVATDTAGDLHIADVFNQRVRRIELFTSCAAEGYSGSRLTLCRQVCEIDQTPARLLSLIRLYRTAYRMDPPCAQ